MKSEELQRWFDENLPDAHIRIFESNDRMYVGFKIAAQTEISTFELSEMKHDSLEMLNLLQGLESNVLQSIGLLTVQGSIIGALMNEIRENHKRKENGPVTIGPAYIQLQSDNR